MASWLSRTAPETRNSTEVSSVAAIRTAGYLGSWTYTDDDNEEFSFIITLFSFDRLSDSFKLLELEIEDNCVFFTAAAALPPSRGPSLDKSAPFP
jgi:hypothetical protein